MKTEKEILDRIDRLHNEMIAIKIHVNAVCSEIDYNKFKAIKNEITTLSWVLQNNCK